MEWLVIFMSFLPTGVRHHPVDTRLEREAVAKQALGSYLRHRMRPAHQSWFFYSNQFLPEDEINEEILTLEEKSSLLSLRAKKIDEKNQLNEVIYSGHQEIDSNGIVQTSIYGPDQEIQGTIENLPSTHSRLSFLKLFDGDHQLIATGKIEETLDHRSRIIFYPCVEGGVRGGATVIMNQLALSEGGGWEVLISKENSIHLAELFCRFLASFCDIPSDVWTRFKLRQVVLVVTASVALGVSVDYFGDDMRHWLEGGLNFLKSPSGFLRTTGEGVAEEVTETLLQTSDGVVEGSYKGIKDYIDKTPWQRQVPLWMAFGAYAWHVAGRRFIR